MADRRTMLDRLDAPWLPFSVVVRVALGAYFLHAGIVKALSPVDFLKAIRLYDMLPETPAILLNGTAIVLPWVEIVCGVALILGIFRRGAATLIALMLCVFTPAILRRTFAVMAEGGISFFDVAFDCGCGTGVEIIWIKTLKNSGLLLLAILAFVSRSSVLSLGGLFGGSRRPAVPEATPEVDRPDPQPKRTPVSVGEKSGD